MTHVVWRPSISKTDDEHYAIEICRTFAGIEDALGDNPDSCLPLFAALVLAISTCPQELRPWFWYKLAHFEQLGLATFENPILKSLLNCGIYQILGLQ